MQLYLPIAEMSVNPFGILLLGGATGVLSGMFGVGGGFLMTPFLMFIGVAPAVAVATSANQIIAASLSGFLAHLRRGSVDFRMGNALLIGGVVGSTLGVGLFRMLQRTGHIDLIIAVSYVVFLSLVGGLMAWESIRALRRRAPLNMPEAPTASWRERLPWQVEFPRSAIRVSAWLPLGIGAFVGVLVSLLGIGGGFFLVPAMIYLLRMPASMVVGTSLYQIIFITANVTFLQALTTQTVDIVLALLLLTGSSLGAQAGSRLGVKLHADHLRGLLAVLVLAVAVKLGAGLFVPPNDPYVVESSR